MGLSQLIGCIVRIWIHSGWLTNHSFPLVGLAWVLSDPNVSLEGGEFCLSVDSGRCSSCSAQKLCLLQRFPRMWASDGFTCSCVCCLGPLLQETTLRVHTWRWSCEFGPSWRDSKQLHEDMALLSSAPCVCAPCPKCTLISCGRWWREYIWHALHVKRPRWFIN